MSAAPNSKPAWLSVWMSASAALFYLLMLTAFSGYSWGAAFLALGGLIIWTMDVRSRSRGGTAGGPAGTGLASGGAMASRGDVRVSAAARSRALTLPPAPLWSREDRLLCWLLLAVFVINAVAVWWHGDTGKYLDQGTRYLLAIPVLYGLRRVSLRLGWIAAALVIGTIGAAVVAWWQINHLQLTRAEGFVTSAIPFSDIALTMGFWCLMAAVWAAAERRKIWTIVLLLAGLAGGYAMVAAATRGSLLAVPALVVLSAVALLRRNHLKIFLVGLVVVLAGAVLALKVLPVGKVADGRYVGAFTEWQEYSQEGEVSNNTVGPRLEAWKAALMSIPERPVLGWGHAQYESHLQELIDAGRVNPFVETLANTHNNFVEIWLHQGTLGLGAILTLFLTSFWCFARRLWAPDLLVRVLACCGASLPASFAAYSLTQVILGRNNGVMFFLVSLVILWAAMRGAECPVTAGSSERHRLLRADLQGAE